MPEHQEIWDLHLREGRGTGIDGLIGRFAGDIIALRSIFGRLPQAMIRWACPDCGGRGPNSEQATVIGRVHDYETRCPQNGSFGSRTEIWGLGFPPANK